MRAELRSLMLLSALALCGCAAQVATLQNPPPRAPESGLKVIDARPAKEKESEILSLMITNCNYGIYQAGDDKITPPRIELLRDDLNQRLGEAASGKTLTVTRYWVHFNDAARLRQTTYGANAGLIADVMSPMGANCPREKVRAGWYTSHEAPRGMAPYIVEIQGQYQGRDLAVRVVHEPDTPGSAAWGQPTSAASVFEAIRKATDQLATAMR